MKARRGGGTQSAFRTSLYISPPLVCPKFNTISHRYRWANRRITGCAHPASCTFVGPHLRPDAETLMDAATTAPVPRLSARGAQSP